MEFKDGCNFQVDLSLALWIFPEKSCNLLLWEFHTFGLPIGAGVGSFGRRTRWWSFALWAVRSQLMDGTERQREKQKENALCGPYHKTYFLFSLPFRTVHQLWWMTHNAKDHHGPSREGASLSPTDCCAMILAELCEGWLLEVNLTWGLAFRG